MAIIKKTKSHMKKSLKRHSKKSLKQTKRKVMRVKVMRGGSSNYATGVPPVNLAAIAQAAQAFPRRRNKQSEAISVAATKVLSMPVPRTKMGQTLSMPSKIKAKMMRGR